MRSTHTHTHTHATVRGRALHPRRRGQDLDSPNLRGHALPEAQPVRDARADALRLPFPHPLRVAAARQRPPAPLSRGRRLRPVPAGGAQPGLAGRDPRGVAHGRGQAGGGGCGRRRALHVRWRCCSTRDVIRVFLHSPPIPTHETGCPPASRSSIPSSP